MSRVSVVIPTWNRADLVESVVRSLRDQTRQPDEVLVVDNGSTDGSVDVARGLGAEVIALERNFGFAVAVNRGIEAATGDWILILNNDVMLPPDWLKVLAAAAEESGAAFAVGKLLQSDEGHTIDGSWDLISRGACAWRCGYGRPDSTVWSTRRSIRIAPMTAALFHKRVFEQVGLLETRFESYLEDVDFGLRCAAEGLDGVYVPEATAVHMSHSTLGKASYRVIHLSSRNQVLLIAKHYPKTTIRRFAWPLLIGQFLAVIAFAKTGQIRAALTGKRDGWRLWREFRATVPADPGVIERVLAESENEIRALQRSVGFEPYWRLYFALGGGRGV